MENSFRKSSNLVSITYNLALWSAVLISLAGSQRIDNQIGFGLVAIVQNSQKSANYNSCVYLEVYYKHGEYNIAQWRSNCIAEAMDELEREMEKDGMLDEWEDMSEEEREDEALERCQKNVDEQRGWGAVLKVPGVLVAQAS
jgi:hypothetical protein